VRNAWLVGALGMALIWVVESAADEVQHPDFRIVIACWVAAAIALFHCARPYAMREDVCLGMRLGLLGQCIAHAVWIVDDAVLPDASIFHPNLEIATDTGELVALVSYISALVLAKLSRLADHARQDPRPGPVIEKSPRDEPATASRLRICFPYIAQLHQVLHSLPIAASLAQRHPGVEVHVAGVSREHVRFARGLVERHAGHASIHYDRLYMPWLARLQKWRGASGGKKRTLKANRLYFAGFDAVVTPERTSTYLRKLAPQRLQLIGTEHGAGDRDVTFASETALYDFLLLPGEKQASRLLALEHIRPDRYVSGIYSKLDWTLRGERLRAPLFDNGRPTVLYNPHFEAELSSWPLIGWEVLDWFARSERFNLIFAPHVRLFDPPRRAKYAPFRKYRDLPHLRIDLGSQQCIDMSYTLGADLYLGDVSSQVVEFLVQPRPCLFLNPRRTPWRHDLHYRFWNLGPVIEDVSELDRGIERSLERHAADFSAAQKQYLRDTLGPALHGDSAARGADAIVDYLRSVNRP
jgi:hypothetical protein